jgi:hypothetical protein
VVEISLRYDDLVTLYGSEFVILPVNEKMTGPVYVYYELTNFYQNHRKYVKSRDDDQLAAGDSVHTSSEAYSTNCDPWYESTYTSNGVETTKQLYPCGLVARSVFNDTYTFSSRSQSSSSFASLSVDQSPSTISWSQDVEKKFNQANPMYQVDGTSLYEKIDMWLLKTFPPQVCLPTSPDILPVYRPVATVKLSDGMEVVDCDFSDASSPTCNFKPPCTGSEFSPVTNPAGWGLNNAHFINWMRTAGLSTFRKLYGKIDQSFEAGDQIKIGIQSNFPVSSYSGTKSIVLSTTTWAGGKNNFLGISYLVVGGLTLVFTAVYTIMHLKRPRRLVDLDYLDWGESH